MITRKLLIRCSSNTQLLFLLCLKFKTVQLVKTIFFDKFKNVHDNITF